MSLQLFPARNDLPWYSMTISLTGVLYTFQLRFNPRMNRWIMNVLDPQLNPIMMGVVILINVSLLSQYPTLPIPAGIFFSLDNTNTDSQPVLDSFGLDHTLYYQDDA